MLHPLNFISSLGPASFHFGMQAEVAFAKIRLYVHSAHSPMDSYIYGLIIIVDCLSQNGQFDSLIVSWQWV